MLEAEKKGSTVEMKLAKITNEVKKHFKETTTRFEHIKILELMVSYLDYAMQMRFSLNCLCSTANNIMRSTIYFD